MSEPSDKKVSERKRRERMKRYARLQAGERITHGRLSSYNQWGCRCSQCTAAYMEWYTAYATRKPPTRKPLPEALDRLAAEVTPELADLISEQYADDRSQRVGYANRLSRYEGPEA